MPLLSFVIRDFTTCPQPRSQGVSLEGGRGKGKALGTRLDLAPVGRRVDNAIHWVMIYPLNSVIYPSYNWGQYSCDLVNSGRNDRTKCVCCFF